MGETSGPLQSQVSRYRIAARSMSQAFLSLSDAGQLAHAEQLRNMACDIFGTDDFDHFVAESSKSVYGSMIPTGTRPCP